MSHWRYEPETHTIRTVPENYCVTAIRNFGEGGHTYAALDLDAVRSLIAAAPELLDALVLALPYVEMAALDPVYKPGAVEKVTRMMKNSILKAKGWN